MKGNIRVWNMVYVQNICERYKGVHLKSFSNFKSKVISLINKIAKYF